VEKKNIFVIKQISLNVNPWQAFLAQFNVRGQGQEPKLDCMTLEGLHSARLCTNIIQCYKDPSGTNTLAYYEHLKITNAKTFLTLS
jgi:hypothetical protein